MRSSAITSLVILLLVGMAIGGSALAAKKTPVTPEVVTWELTKSRIIDPGQTIVMEQGTLVQGFVVEAKAKTKAKSKLIPEGTFELTMDVFSPSRDLPGQKAGMHYVQGKWSVARKNISPESKNARHSVDRVNGDMQAGLAVNPMDGLASASALSAAPTGTDGGWSAKATLPMSPAAGQWARGEGSISFDGKGGGDLFLDTLLWPESP